LRKTASSPSAGCCTSAEAAAGARAERPGNYRGRGGAPAPRSCVVAAPPGGPVDRVGVEVGRDPPGLRRHVDENCRLSPARTGFASRRGSVGRQGCAVRCLSPAPDRRGASRRRCGRCLPPPVRRVVSGSAPGRLRPCRCSTRLWFSVDPGVGEAHLLHQRPERGPRPVRWALRHRRGRYAPSPWFRAHEAHPVLIA
jgi:hypothetical protein